MSAWREYWGGVRRAGRSWQILFVLWLGELAPALFLALLPAFNLLGASRLTAFLDAASGIPAWMASELLASFSSLQNNLGFDLARVFDDSFFSTMVIWLLIIPPIAWLSSSFLYGGMLTQYTHPEEAFQSRRFFSNCWRWWGKYLLMGIIQALLGLVILVVSLVLLVLGLSLSIWLAILVLTLALLVLGLWLALFELSRVQLAAGEEHSLFRSLSHSASLVRRRPGMLLGYYLLALFALLFIHLVFRLGIFPVLPLAVWPLVFILQQAFIILRLWSRAARYAGNFSILSEGKNPQIDIA